MRRGRGEILRKDSEVRPERQISRQRVRAPRQLISAGRNRHEIVREVLTPITFPYVRNNVSGVIECDRFSHRGLQNPFAKGLNDRVGATGEESRVRPSSVCGGLRHGHVVSNRARGDDRHRHNTGRGSRRHSTESG